MFTTSLAFARSLRAIKPSSSWCRRACSHKAHGDAVEISSLSATFPYVWLRDSCQCPSCVHPSTRQKLHKSSDIDFNVRPIRLEHSSEGLSIQWEAQNEETAHESFYPTAFLRRHSSKSALTAFHRDIWPESWTSHHFSSRTSHELSTPYASLKNPRTLLSAFTDLAKTGLVFIRDVPTEATSDSECELRNLAQIFGSLRNTFYGETWDVINVRDSKNIAYTNLDLGLHMDLLYFKEPPRYQILHCLRNRVEGGHSLFVDGLNAAVQLHRDSEKDFFLLTDRKVRFHYINDGHHLHCSHPTITINERPDSPSSPLSNSKGVNSLDITSINYSPPFQAPLDPDTPPSFFQALANYASILNKPDNCFKHLLREGDAVIFDNRRVLHGRTAFRDWVVDDARSAISNGETTNRWLKGCYLEEDAVLDKRRVLSTKLELPQVY